MLMIAQIRSADNRNMGSDRWLLAKIHRRDAEKNSEDSPRFLKKQLRNTYGAIDNEKTSLLAFLFFRLPVFSPRITQSHFPAAY